MISPLFIIGLIGCASAQLPNFTNPILDTPAANPNTFRLGDRYYLTLSGNQNTEIHILRSRFLTNFRYVERKVVYKTNVGYTDLQSPKMHSIHGQLYLYFSMRNETVSQGLYVMKAQDPNNPMGKWGAPRRLLENIWSLTSIHGTVLNHNDLLYFVWASMHPVAESRGIYIAQMNSRTQVIEPIVSLRQPTETWECQGLCDSEAPSFIYNIDGSYMVFSASSSNHPDHCISYMSIESGKDPMNISNWKSAAGPVFTKSEEEGVFATGHSSFTTSPDGTETWMVYHGSDSNTDISGNLLARIEKIAWDFDTGAPHFPIPHGSSNPQPRPSGEPEMFTNPILDEDSPDPSVIRLGDFYYLVLYGSNRTELVIWKSRTLTDFRNAEKKTIFRANEGHGNICCGEIHLLDGGLYVYFAMHVGTFPRSPFVISALNSSDPMSNWTDSKRMMENVWDGNYDQSSVLSLNNRSYFTWSAQAPTNDSWRIYIAQMQNPGEIVSPVVLLRQPTEPWKCLTSCYNAGPAFIYNNNVAYMVFTANNGQVISLSYMSIESGRDPLDISNWESVLEPIFTGNNNEDVLYPDLVHFTTSPDGTETWMIYHASENATAPIRTSRIEKIKWDVINGDPVFPKPHGRNNPQPIPRK